MTKFSDVLAAGVTIRESANDGSDFSNPTADYRRLFLGEDGLLYVKDSSGTVTSPYAGGSSAEFATAVSRVATSQTTTSTSFADLATTGPSVTVTVGASGKVKLSMSALASNSGASENYIGIVVSGANTIAAATKMALYTASGGTNMECGTVKLLDGLTPGSTTFKMQYAVLAGTGTFSRRELIAEAVF